MEVRAAVIGRLYLHYNVEFWILFITDSGIGFSYQGESFRSNLLRSDVELEPISFEVDIEKLLARNHRNFFLETAQVRRVVYKPATWFRMARLCIERLDGTKLSLSIGHENKQNAWFESFCQKNRPTA